MSRIGKKPIAVPDKVQVEVVNNWITVKGTQGVNFQKRSPPAHFSGAARGTAFGEATVGQRGAPGRCTA